MSAAGRIESLWRYPVKGFTPERLDAIDFAPGVGVPFDRVFAVENGPSGFDPEAPAHVAKMRFAVLASIPKVARARTRFDDKSNQLSVETDEGVFTARLDEPEGRRAFARWLQDFLGEDASGQLQVLAAPRAHRFYDDPRGRVSIINLASVRDLSERIGRPVDPLRFRANVHVEGWPPWIELDAAGAHMSLGHATARVIAPIRRCVATHVDPDRGVRDLDMLEALRGLYGHVLCGIYADIIDAGRARPGDDAEVRP
ncbi:MAG: MOSC domain-containing protein [Alphaproteobacteria bacterium]|nr:MOSC domain-containing protein [Alphaproteobacteria bacterium]